MYDTSLEIARMRKRPETPAKITKTMVPRMFTKSFLLLLKSEKRHHASPEPQFYVMP
jgi:hypothetical protein